MHSINPPGQSADVCTGIYGAMALTGRFICQMAGIDCTGGFHPSLTALVEGLGYAAPPIMALLFILDVCTPSTVLSFSALLRSPGPISIPFNLPLILLSLLN